MPRSIVGLNGGNWTTRMKLYDYSGAANARRVRVFLAEKGISIPSEQIDIALGANLDKTYLDKVPRGLVPALEIDDGSILDESVAICRYIERLHPVPNLMGMDPLEEARIESWERRCERDGFLPAAHAFREVAPLFVDRAVPGAMPSLPQIPELAERGRTLVAAFFSMLNERLSTSHYVAGDRFTIADITALVTIGFAKWSRIDIEPDQTDLLRWYKEVRARPSASA